MSLLYGIWELLVSLTSLSLQVPTYRVCSLEWMFFSVLQRESKQKPMGRHNSKPRAIITLLLWPLFNDFAHIPWEDTPNSPKPPQRKKFLHKLLVKFPGYLPGVCGWDLRFVHTLTSNCPGFLHYHRSHTWPVPGRQPKGCNSDDPAPSVSGSPILQW